MDYAALVSVHRLKSIVAAGTKHSVCHSSCKCTKRLGTLFSVAFHVNGDTEEIVLISVLVSGKGCKILNGIKHITVFAYEKSQIFARYLNLHTLIILCFNGN